MTEKIVVGTDGSETAKQAVAEAVRLAKALGAELHVVTAGKTGGKIVGAPKGALPVYGPVDSGLRGAVSDEAVADARVAGVTAEAYTPETEPADALLEIAKRIGADMIVVGNKGMTGGRRLLGSIPNKVSHEADCNVLIVHTS
jgi:nucleotide-binding universal stress UspA family protein